MHQNTWKWVTIGIISALVVATTVLMVTDRRIESPNTTITEGVSITIAGRSFNSPAGETVLKMLSALDKTDPLLKLETKEYVGLGALVTSMYGHTNGVGENYWQYTVNGVAPQVGAGEYRPVPGDRIVWTYEQSKF